MLVCPMFFCMSCYPDCVAQLPMFLCAHEAGVEIRLSFSMN